MYPFVAVNVKLSLKLVPEVKLTPSNKYATDPFPVIEIFPEFAKSLEELPFRLNPIDLAPIVWVPPFTFTVESSAFTPTLPSLTEIFPLEFNVPFVINIPVLFLACDKSILPLCEILEIAPVWLFLAYIPNTPSFPLIPLIVPEFTMLIFLFAYLLDKLLAPQIPTPAFPISIIPLFVTIELAAP